MRKLIKVTQKHINKGIRGEEGSCPVALAMDESGFSYPRIGENYISYSNDEYGLDRYSPRSVQRFVRKFDQFGRRKVKPFNFFFDTERYPEHG